MTVCRYRIDADPDRAIALATQKYWSRAKPLIVLGPPACIVRFDAAAELLLFLLARPADWCSVEGFGLDLVLPIDCHFVLPSLKPVLKQVSLIGKVRICDVVFIDLPADSDHTLLLERIKSCGIDAGIY